MKIFPWILAFHITAASVSLALVWIPWLTRKGSPLHRRVGGVYALAMAAVALSAFLMCGIRLSDTDPANDGPALFLAFVGVLSGSASISGIGAVRTKGRRAPTRNIALVVPPVILLVFASYILVTGVVTLSPIRLPLAAVGVFSALGRLRFWLRAPATPREWLFEHISGMGTTCIASLTALLVVNAARLGLTGPWGLLVWGGAPFLGGATLASYIRSQRKRFAPTPAAQRAPGLKAASGVEQASAP